MSKVIVFAAPVFFLLIAIEWAWGLYKGRNTYALSDAISSIGLGMLSQLAGVFTRLLRVGIYTAVYSSVAVWQNDAFWLSGYGWLLALLLYDFCYYWLHRMGHESAVLWAAHVVHHQSQSYNLSTALRQTSSGMLLGWVFYLPMALAGVPPFVFGIVALVDLLYQYWVHTEHVPRLGWFDRWFCSPSNHRVHHAVNDVYVDKNYGGILVVWDRLFGSFTEEREPCVYGTRKALNSWDPLWANAQVYAQLAHDSWYARSWADKLRVWLKPPGWRPADVAARFAQPTFRLADVRRFNPPTSRAVQAFACLQFVLLMVGVLAFLWVADAQPLARMAVCWAVLCTGLWALGAMLQGRIGMLVMLLLEVAALSTATAALGLPEWHYVFKPLALLLAIIFVASNAHLTGVTSLFSSQNRLTALLLAALCCCGVGDVLLMLPGLFVPGLLAFLCGHLFYIAMLRQGQAWFPSRKALLATLAYGATMYALLLGYLPTALRLPVAVYALVIALMAAQALGRANVLRDAASRWVAVGALCFMLSDSLLALNKFVLPLQLWGLAAPFWVLSSYYAAQILIALYAQPERVVRHFPNENAVKAALEPQASSTYQPVDLRP